MENHKHQGYYQSGASDLRERLEAIIKDIEVRASFHSSPSKIDEILRQAATLREVLASPHLLMGEPVGWRCKDYADDWYVCKTKEGAARYHDATGCLVQPLYAPPSKEPT